MHGVTFARRLFCTSVTFARGDTFARRHFCTQGHFCTRGHFCTVVTFARQNFCTTLHLHGDIFAKRQFSTALHVHGNTYELRKFKKISQFWSELHFCPLLIFIFSNINLNQVLFFVNLNNICF